MQIEYDKSIKDINVYASDTLDYGFWFVWKIIIPIASIETAILFIFRYALHDHNISLSARITSAAIVLLLVVAIFVWFHTTKTLIKNRFFEKNDSNHYTITKDGDDITISNETLRNTSVFAISEIKKYKIYKKTIIITVCKIGNLLFPNLPEIREILEINDNKKAKD